MNAKTKEFREKIANEFVKVLEENPLTWKKSWQANQLLPHNAVTGRKYNGINMFYLNLLAKDNMWEDPRFATFKQIQNAGWKLKKGSEGIQIEYWMPYDAENHKAMTWDAYRQLTDEEKKEICIKPKYSYVFNAKDIEGIPAMPEPEIHEVNPDTIIGTISKNMQVEIVNDGGSRAFYRPSDDKVHLPKTEYFNDSAAYNSVALHELAHASGAPNRLNRDLSGSFGTSSYAYEELIAEISSAFMSAELAQPVSDFEMENHKAYVQSWIQAIKDRPETLFKAIKDAERCSNYLSFQAELISEKEYQKLTLDPDMKGKDEKVIDQKKWDSIVAQQGISDLQLQECWFDNVDFSTSSGFSQTIRNCDFSNSDFTNCKINTVDFTDCTFLHSNLISCNIYNAGILHSDFSHANISGTTIEMCDFVDTNMTETHIIGGSIKDTAFETSQMQGFDLRDTFCSGVTGLDDISLKEIEKNIIKSGHKPTERMIDNIKQINRLTGRENTMKDICKAFKERTYADQPKIDELVSAIAEECKIQETMRAVGVQCV